MSKMALAMENLLLERVKAGSADAFSELVRLNSSSVYGISLKILKNREDAEDNLQNVFFKAYRKICNFQGGSRVSTWLFRIAVNEALMQLRRKPGREVHCSEIVQQDEEGFGIPEALDSRPDPEMQCIALDLKEKIFHGCAPAMANIFALNKVEGWTNGELAKAHGTSAQTIKSRVFRTRMRLRRQMAVLASASEPAASCVR